MKAKLLKKWSEMVEKWQLGLAGGGSY